MCVNFIAFVIFIVISDVASLDVCTIKDGKVMNIRIVLKDIVQLQFKKHLDESMEIDLQHCFCKRKVQKLLTDDTVLSNQTTCSLDAFKRGSGQKIVGFSLYGDYNSKKR